MTNGTHYEEHRDCLKYNYRCFHAVCWWGPRFGDDEIGYEQYERICDWFREHIPEPWTTSGVLRHEGAMHIFSWVSAESAIKIWRKWSPNKPFSRFEVLDPRQT